MFERVSKKRGNDMKPRKKKPQSSGGRDEYQKSGVDEDDRNSPKWNETNPSHWEKRVLGARKKRKMNTRHEERTDGERKTSAKLRSVRTQVNGRENTRKVSCRKR